MGSNETTCLVRGQILQNLISIEKNPLKNLYKDFMNERSFKEFSFTIIHVLHAWVSDNAVGHGFSSIDGAHAHLVLLFL